MAFEPQPFGRYLLLNRIALGGMAEIFQAKTLGAVGFEKRVAIKRILPHLSQNQDFINMLIDEAKIAVELTHVNIAQVYDLGKVDTNYFIAMEYVEGRDLRSVIKRLDERKERMRVENAVFIVLEICKGLDYAHRKKDARGAPIGIVHRDISPQNILISYEGEVKIVDFGIAKAARKVTETEVGALKGKFAYMSPEQAGGLEVDSRSDIFSTGILLYELLTGEKLFLCKDTMQTIAKIRSFQIEPPFLPADVPSELEFILMQALENDPGVRYQAASDFQADLSKFLYSSAADFTSRSLAELMHQLFGGELVAKTKAEVNEDESELDTETRMLMAAARQEVLVHRQDDLSLVTLPPRPAGTMKPKVKKPPMVDADEVFRSLKPAPLKSNLWQLYVLVIAIALAGVAYLFASGRLDWPPKVLVRIFGRKEAVKAKPASLEMSSLRVESIPAGAKVFLDQKDMGMVTPATLKDVVPRVDHELRVKLANYTEHRRTFRTEPGESLQVQLPLMREKGALEVRSVPPGATVYLDNEVRGKTPLKIESLPTNVDITVRIVKEGYQVYSQVVRVAVDKPNVLDHHLVKARARGKK